MQNVALIGSNGFIGKNLARRLRQEPGINLKLFGRSQPLQDSDSSYKRLDLTDQAAAKKDFENIELVYYLASETIPASSWLDPKMEIERNLLPFIDLLETIGTGGIKKVVFLSSAGTVYGPAREKIAETAATHPFSPYGIIKLAMENFLNYYKHKNALSFDVFRVSNVYGEGQNTGKGLGLINTFIENIIRERKVHVYGDGNALRNYIYVADVVDLLVTLPLKRNTENSGIFNLASDDTLSINQIVSILREVVAEPFEVVYEAARKSDISYIDPDNAKVKKAVTGYNFTPVEKGIRQTYQFIKKQQSSTIK